MNTICRICLEEKKKYFLIPISVEVEEGSIIELINYCSSIIINIDEKKYPLNVCHQCLQKLKVGYEIKRKCLESNDKLKSLLINIKNETAVEFVEMEPIEENDSVTEIWKEEFSDNDDKSLDLAEDIWEEELKDNENNVLDSAVNNDIHKKILKKGGRETLPKQINLPFMISMNSYEKPSFICDFCGLVLKNKSNLKIHFRKEHKTKKEIVCNLCKLEFRYASSLRVHKKYHRGERHFKCDQCPKQFILNCELIRHKKNHTVQNMEVCKFCGKVFSNHYLKKHRVFCEKKAMENPEQLENARIAMLDLQSEYTCDLCSLKVKGKSFLNTHIRRTHLKKKQENTSQKVFHCNFINCNKKFQQRYNLVIHKRLHNNRTLFPCDKCSRTFIKESMFIKHQKSLACQGNLVNCLICQKSFSSITLMEKHYTLKHTEKEKKDPKPKENLEFFCEFCGKRITSRSNLQKHLLVHHKDESKYKEFPVFKCRFCVKEFVYRHDLMIHECIHTNFRPFKCDINGCTKAFIQSSKVKINNVSF